VGDCALYAGERMNSPKCLCHLQNVGELEGLVTVISTEAALGLLCKN